MITSGSKWFFGFGAVSFVTALVYGWTTGGKWYGPLTAGYRGPVGDHLGYGLLATAALIGFFLGFVSIAMRDAEAEALAWVAGTDTASVPEVTPVGTSYWPPLAAFGAALVVVGLVSEAVVFVFGLIILGIVLVEWTVQTWADHATGDPEVNRQIRNRVMNPIEFPVAAALVLATLAICFSRVFLSLTPHQTVIAGVCVLGTIVAGGFFVASRPHISKNVVVGLLVAFAVLAIAVGVIGGIAGQRDAESPAPAPISGVVQ